MISEGKYKFLTKRKLNAEKWTLTDENSQLSELLKIVPGGSTVLV